MIDSKKTIRLYDDTNRGDDFEVTEILFENDNVMLCLVSNEWHFGDKNIEVLIYKSTREVVSKELDFYYAESI